MKLVRWVCDRCKKRVRHTGCSGPGDHMDEGIRTSEDSSPWIPETGVVLILPNIPGGGHFQRNPTETHLCSTCVDSLQAWMERKKE